jgi:phage tail sheath protein FI
MPIVQQGALNTTALTVPDIYVQIVPPQAVNLNGVPSDVYGVVGTATWGPVGVPVVCSGIGTYTTSFGTLQPRLYDMGTYVAVAQQQGAQNFRCVRVTDGTDVAASAILLTSLAVTAKYTGSLGNSLVITIGPGSAASTTKVTVAIPGYTTEVFDRIAGTGGTLWTNVAAAINNGNSLQRGPSNFITATASGGTTAAPTTATSYAMSGGTGVTSAVSGTDGVGSMTDTLAIGSDTTHTGMYALRGLKCGIVTVCDVTSYAVFPSIVALAQQEAFYAILAEAAGQTSPSTSVSNKQSAGIDTPWAKVMYGDWLWWLDTTNGLTRLVSPAAFMAGRLANLSPQNSSLNKSIVGISGSQKVGLAGSGQSKTYASADLSVLELGGMDVITTPVPGGNYWSARIGHNSSSNSAVNGDNYTRMTDYLATTLNAGLGIYIGALITPALLSQITATLNNFLQNLVGQGLLSKTIVASGQPQLPFSVICNGTNNPLSQTSLGYVQADIAIQYTSINEKFIVNLQGGVTVQTTATTTLSQ